jgi:hypothetical protein
MPKYEFIREIFNSCSGNQMRDVDIKEIETDSIEEIAKTYIESEKSEVEIIEDGKGTTIYNITNAGLPERLTFSKLDS